MSLLLYPLFDVKPILCIVNDTIIKLSLWMEKLFIDERPIVDLDLRLQSLPEAVRLQTLVKVGPVRLLNVGEDR